MRRLTIRVVCRFAVLILAVVLPFMAAATNASAATIFESGTLGPTGIPWSDLTNGTVPGTNLSSLIFPGVRFHVDQPVTTTQVGGHFVSPISGTFFGAIVALDDANDFPNSTNLSTPDVLGAATLAFPNPSAEVYGSLNLSLDPGWYALVFGTGLFGTSGGGGAPRNNTDIGDPSYIGFEPNIGWHQLNRPPFFLHNHRFVVYGQVVPEPRTLATVLFVLTACWPLRMRP